MVGVEEVARGWRFTVRVVMITGFSVTVLFILFMVYTLVRSTQIKKHASP